MTPPSNPGIDTDRPALARIYDYVLGGGHHFAADREVARKILDIIPGYQNFALENRSFLRRAALHMLDTGIDQFLDLGSGLLSFGPVHEIVHNVNPEGRVVYVDNDPVVTANVELRTGDDPRIGVIHSDLRDVPGILDHETTRRVLDPHRPLGVFAVAVLHCVPDSDHLVRVLSGYHARLAAGSMLAASHASGERLDPDLTAAGRRILADAGITAVSRTCAEFAALLGPWQPDPDGVVALNWWRPEGVPNALSNVMGYAVMATREATAG
jgi:S-adenosyl methyltransferase